VSLLVKRSIAIVAGLGLLVLAGCRDDDRPAAAGTVRPATGTTPPAPSPTPTGPADLRCLVAGSPWKVSKPDLESQLTGRLRGVDVTGVHITGDQILTVTPGLQAKFVDTTTTKITIAMDAGITMVMTQQHDGSAAGRWTAGGAKLTPSGAWTGKIKTKTRVEINGRAANSPASFPTQALGDVPMNYTCVDGVLNLTVPGSPFVYLFR
jgi:hypothetical protein